MAYQDDFRNKVIAALKAKNLAVDISQEATQQAIVEEAQIVAESEPQPMSPEEMKQVLQDVATQLASENEQVFSAQSADFTAFKDQLSGGGPVGPGGSYSGGGIAMSTANKDIMIIPAAGGLGAAGSATSVNSLSQIDFKHIANPNAYGVFDPNEVKASLFNWAERITGNLFDTPVLGIGGAWGGVSYAPTSSWGVGTSTGSGVGASINTNTGFGQIIYFKPATSTIYASLFNDIGLDTSASNGNLTITGYSPAVPGAFPTSGFAVTFGGIGGSGDLIIQGAALNTQTNTVKFSSPLTISNSTVTDTLTLGLSAANSTVQNFVGGGTAQYALSTTTTSFTAGQIFYASSTGHTHLVPLNKGANNSYLRVDGTGNYEWTTTISATTANVAAATGVTVLYPIMNNSTASGVALSYDIDFNVDPGNNILRYASGSFYVGTAVSAPTYTGAGSLVTYTSPASVVIKPGANATTAIALQKADGTNILVVDSTNNRIGINMTPGSFALDVTGSANLSSGNAYNIAGVSVLNASTLGANVVSSSLTSVGTIATGIWQGTSIGTTYGGTGSNLGGNTANANKLVVLGSAANGYAATLIDGTGTGNVLTSNNNASAPSFVAPSTLSVGFATTTSNIYVVANSVNADNYITFTPSTSSSTSGVGLSISNQASQLTYNPSFQQLKVPNITGTAFTASNLTGTLLTAAQNNITSASSLATVGTITTGRWQGTAVGTTYGGTGSDLGSAIGNSNKIVVLGPIANGYAATVIDGANSGYLLMANGNSAAPSFVNSTNAAFSFASGTLTINNAAVTTGTITGTPTSANDIVNKAYADSISGGLDVHASGRLTTIAAIGGSYRQSGIAGTLSGFGDYIIATAPNTAISSEAGFDTAGTALTHGQRVLIKDGVLGGYASGTGNYGAYPTTYGGFAASWVANGIYEVRSNGGAATSGWLLVRATDTDNQNGVQELTGGTFLFIEEGSFYADHAFVCSNDTTSLGPIGFGSTQISWTLFAGGNTLIPGQGLVESGNNLALLFNLVQNTQISASNFFSRGFTIGGPRAASLGSSSLNTFTVTGVSDSVSASNTLTANTTGFTLAGGQTNTSLVIAGVAANNTITGIADGWNHAGGTTPRTLTVTGGDITLTGSGTTLTLSTTGTLSLNSQSLSLTASMGNVTFAGSLNPTATTQTVVMSGQTQYQLSSQTNSWAAGDMYYMGGTAFTALTRLALGSGVGASVLIRSTTAPVWGTINLASSDFVSGILPLTSGGTNANLTASNGGVVYSTATAFAIAPSGTGGSVFISNGTNAPSWQVLNLQNSNSITGVLQISNGGTNNGSLSVTAGQVVYTDGSKLVSTTAGTAGQPLLSNGASAPAFGTLTLAGGGTSNIASGTAVQYQLAAYNAAGNGISGIAQPTVSNSVLIQSAANNLPQWSNGPLAIAYGGSNATSFTNTNGAVIFDGTRLVTATGTTITSGVGISVNGTINSLGGFFTGGNSVVTSVTPSGGSAIYGAVTIAVANNNPAGALSISGASQTITINGPGTGITGTGAATQVAYYNAARELTGNVGLVYSPTAATGVGLSVNVNAASGTVIQVNTAQALTSGLLMDIDNNGSQRYTIDFKGMATHTVGSGNTALVVVGGRTILAAPSTNYATLNLGNTNANPGAGNTQIGDLWFNGTNLYFRRDANTSFDLLVGSVSGSGTANKVAKWNTSSALTDSNITDAGVGMTITSTTSIGAGGGSTAVLTLQTISADNSLTDRYFLRGVTSAGTRLFSIDTAGNLRATTKSFDIPHPTKEGLRLVYGVLEGPEHGVYHRGTAEGKGIVKVDLPEYWHKLVGIDYTIQLTPWGNYNVSIESKTENYFTIQLVGDFISRKFKNIKFDYIVHGSRLDAPLNIEQ